MITSPHGQKTSNHGLCNRAHSDPGQRYVYLLVYACCMMVEKKKQDRKCCWKADIKCAWTEKDTRVWSSDKELLAPSSNFLVCQICWCFEFPWCDLRPHPKRRKGIKRFIFLPEFTTSPLAKYEAKRFRWRLYWNQIQAFKKNAHASPAQLLLGGWSLVW